MKGRGEGAWKARQRKHVQKLKFSKLVVEGRQSNRSTTVT